MRCLQWRKISKQRKDLDAFPLSCLIWREKKNGSDKMVGAS